MKQYLVVQSCVKMPFNKRFFREGEVIEVADDVDPGSACFKLISGKDVVAEVKDEPQTLSALQSEQEKLIDPASGFAENLARIEIPKPPKTIRKKRT
jgi:hypothetical protein